MYETYYIRENERVDRQLSLWKTAPFVCNVRTCICGVYEVVQNRLRRRHARRRGIRLIVGFQLLMVISPTASWIRWCMQVCACELPCEEHGATGCCKQAILCSLQYAPRMISLLNRHCPKNVVSDVNKNGKKSSKKKNPFTPNFALTFYEKTDAGRTTDGRKTDVWSTTAALLKG